MTDSIEDLRDTIVPKSNQLNADDLLAGPETVTITAVRRGTNEQPLDVHLEGDRQPYKPGKSMRRVLIAAWGRDGREWVGRAMTLYCDPEVSFGGVMCGGIRISHLSDIETELTVMLTMSRGKKRAFTVSPLPNAYPAEPKTWRERAIAAIMAHKGEPEVVKACLQAGAKVLNFTGNEYEAEILDLASEFNATVVVCYVGGANVREITDLNLDTDPIPALAAYFEKRIESALSHGGDQYCHRSRYGFLLWKLGGPAYACEASNQCDSQFIPIARVGLPDLPGTPPRVRPL